MNISRLYALLSPQFRLRRMYRFAEEFGIDSGTRILDVGGSHHIWELLPVRPDVVLVNILPPDAEDVAEIERSANLHVVVGDACRLPFQDDAFDLVFSNSLIEHLFTFENQRRFADECRRVAPRYYVQVPNQRFLIEPHLLTPFIHWFPKRARTRLLRNFTVWGLLTRPTREACAHFVEEVRLLTARDLGRLFPEAEIWHERVLGLSKSFMAVRSGRRPDREPSRDDRRAAQPDRMLASPER
jgi:hypothetical protein